MLDQYRTKIDLIDLQISVLFSRRMEQSKKIGEYKKAHVFSVAYTTRQEQILEQLTMSSSPEIVPYLRELFMTIFHLSCTFQEGGQS